MRNARGALATAGAAGVVLLFLATFATIIEITVGGSGDITADVDRELSGYDRHSFALVLLAGAAAAMLVGALRGARPAMLALAVCGITVLLIAVLGDAPDLDDVGPIGDLYEDATAQAGTGFYLETLAGGLLLIAGVGLLVLGGGAVALGGAPGRDPQRTDAAASDPQAPQVEPDAPSPGRRLAAGAGERLAAARAARAAGRERAAARAAARRERDAQEARRREEQAAARAQERAATERAEEERAAARLAQQRDEDGRAAAEATSGGPEPDAPAPVEPDAPAPQAEAPTAEKGDGTAADPAPAPLTFEERLRQARERATRRP